MRNNQTQIPFATERPTFQHRRGTVVPLAAALMAILLAMVAFAIDLGHIVHVDTELQRTADACALAAVQLLPDQEAAIVMAQEVAVDNYRTSGPDLDVSDIEFGEWDRNTATFVPTTSDPNAVRITVRRTAERGNPLELFFAPIMGHSFADVTASSIALLDNEFCGPLIGIEWIDVPGGPITDSYRSSLGRYKWQKARDNGNLCSDGPIVLDGNPIINGHANPGRGYKTTISGNAIVTKSTTPRVRPLELPLVDASDAAENNDNASMAPVKKGNNWVSPVDAQGNFKIDGTTHYTMSPGTYYLKSFEVTGGSSVTFEGATTIYLTGNLDTAGGDIFNTTELPSTVKIFMTGGYADVAAHMDFYGVVYAPNTDVILRGGGDWYGVLTGKTLTLTGNGTIHYDEDLGLEDELNLPKSAALVQ
jgi:Flp pilus assembly protein TadG